MCLIHFSIVKTLSLFFGKLYWFSIYRIILWWVEKRGVEKENRGFVADLYVPICMVFSLTTVFWAHGVWVLCVGAYRLYEIIINQINFLFVKRGTIRSRRRAILLAFFSYFEIVFWFAAALAAQPKLFYFSKELQTHWVCSNLGHNWSTCGYLYSSFINTTTFGTTLQILPKEPLGAFILFLQAVVGFFMTLVILTSFIACLPIRKSTDPAEQDLPIKESIDP